MVLFWGPINTRCRIIFRIQKETRILTTTHIACGVSNLDVVYDRRIVCFMCSPYLIKSSSALSVATSKAVFNLDLPIHLLSGLYGGSEQNKPIQTQKGSRFESSGELPSDFRPPLAETVVAARGCSCSSELTLFNQWSLNPVFFIQPVSSRLPRRNQETT